MHSKKPIHNEIKMLKGKGLEEGHIKENIKNAHRYARGASGSLQHIIHRLTNKQRFYFLLGGAVFVMLNTKNYKKKEERIPLLGII